MFVIMAVEIKYFIENPDTQEWLSDPDLRIKENLPLWTVDALQAWQFESRDDAVLHNVILKYSHCEITEHELIKPSND